MSPLETEKGANDAVPIVPKPQSEAAAARNRPLGPPRHFHLLWDDELEALRPVLELILERLDEVIAHWYQLYVLHFGDQRTLSEREFRDIFQSALEGNTKDLLDGDMDRYAIGTIKTGELLCERSVPFSEVLPRCTCTRRALTRRSRPRLLLHLKFSCPSTS